jgi:lipopolysaccharide transport system permease protein
MIAQDKAWDWEITSKTTWSGTVQELFRYRNLLTRLVRKQFLVNYQQTILGPLWILLQPLLTLLTFVFVFGNLLGISTNGVPPLLFYFCSILLWNYYSESFADVAFTFIYHEDLFRKVYFPRIVIHISYLCTHFLRTMVQLVLFIIVLSIYWIFNDLPVNITGWILFTPLVFIMIAGLSLGFGLIFSVLAGKYRDLANLIYLIVRLAMFVTPVIYPVSSIRPDIQWLVQLNPLSPLFEVFRYAFFADGSFTISQLLYSILFTIIILLSGVYIFNRQGQKLMDVL